MPDEVPLGEVAPPVPEFSFTPKYEKMLWSHPGCDMSVFGSKAGAVCSLLVSPVYVNICCAIAEEVVELPVLAGRSSDHGTATCFVPPAVEVPAADVGEVVPVLPEEELVAL